MRYTNCIFEESKNCNDCGKCDLCDLNNKKTCNNCGKCLEMQDIDTKAIKISSVIEGEEEGKLISRIKDGSLEEELLREEKEEILNDEYTLGYDYKEDKLNDKDITLEFIDDIDGLLEVIDNKGDSGEVFREQYPGLFVINDNLRDKI